MTYEYGCLTRKYAPDAHLLKLQRLQNRVLRATGNLDRLTPVRELYVTIRITYVYGYIRKFSRTYPEVILNHVNPNIGGFGQEEATPRKYKRLQLGGNETYNCPANKVQFQNN
jgi:hypothetical protein